MQTASRRRETRRNTGHNGTFFAVLLFLALLCVAAGAVESVQRAKEKETQAPSFSPSEPTDIVLPSFPLVPVPDRDDPLLLLVNRDNPLPADYAPELTDIGGGQAVDARCADELLEDGPAQ